MKTVQGKSSLFLGLLLVIILGTITLFAFVIPLQKKIPIEQKISTSSSEYIEQSQNSDEVVIVGTVDYWISLSIKAIFLEKPGSEVNPLNGVEVIVLDNDAKIFNQRGEPIDLRDIKESGRMKIKATGVYGTSESLIAKEIIVLGVE